MSPESRCLRLLGKDAVREADRRLAEMGQIETELVRLVNGCILDEDAIRTNALEAGEAVDANRLVRCWLVSKRIQQR